MVVVAQLNRYSKSGGQYLELVHLGKVTRIVFGRSSQFRRNVGRLSRIGSFGVGGRRRGRF